MNRISLATALSISLFAPAAGATGFQVIVAPAEGGAYATAVSADGNVVVGQLSTVNGKVSAFRYTVIGGLVDLGDFPGGTDYATANAASADGSVIVGVGSSTSAVNPGGEALVAFRWTAQTGLVALTDLAGGTEAAFASGVSADGTRIVGASYGAADDYEATTWDGAAPPTSLGTFMAAMPQSTAYGVSANGKVIVGRSPSDTGNANEAGAFLWTAPLGLVGIGDLPGGAVYATAYGVSGDGLVVVGSSSSNSSGPDEFEAFRYTQGGGMQGLGGLFPGLFGSDGLATNSDGSVVVGRSYVDAGGNEEAFYWTASNGIQRLADVAAAAGVDLGGAILRQATGVSADGLVIVGIAQGTKSTAAFRLDLTGSIGSGSSGSSGSSSAASSGVVSSASAGAGGGETSSTVGAGGAGGTTGSTSTSVASTSDAGAGGAGSTTSGGADAAPSGGCGCHLDATETPTNAGLWLAAAAAFVVARRRRRA